LTRRLAFNRARERQADKRGGGELPLLLDELAECIPDTTGETSDDFVVRDALNAFLAALPQRTRTVFLCRYWYAHSVAEIAAACHMSISSVNTLLCRTRKQLAEHLKEQHIEL
jgi:RNA polymerase sigma-70 factor (ECF subfamily)